MGSANRPRGMRRSQSSSERVSPAIMSVLITPGWMEFTRMFCWAYWMAMFLVRRRTAPLEAL